jgi:hypothetical protein
MHRGGGTADAAEAEAAGGGCAAAPDLYFAAAAPDDGAAAGVMSETGGLAVGVVAATLDLQRQEIRSEGGRVKCEGGNRANHMCA